MNPGTIYAHLDEAIHAASCLSVLHANGATVCGARDLYIVTLDASVVQRGTGLTWAPIDGFTPIYTITQAK